MSKRILSPGKRQVVPAGRLCLLALPLLTLGAPLLIAENPGTPPQPAAHTVGQSTLLPSLLLLLDNLPPEPPAPNPDERPRGPRREHPKPGEGKGHKDALSGGSECESIVVVEKFLEMSPERLATIRVMIERLEQMTPEERDAMRERIRNYRQLPDERRARVMEDFHRVPVENRLLLRMYWRSLPPEEAQRERDKLRSLPPEEQSAYREALLEKAREAGISICPPGPPPSIKVPPPPELIPPPFPEGITPPPRPAGAPR